ncbi:P protein isoform X2 [Cylas formicarius]|uniref:P protein isoform X2 n=1 Tax=Cylas formicarius TaxID=197179 RepID=UPI002958D3A5|nr:P protein isoform X2 [Cylas formicarius]
MEKELSLRRGLFKNIDNTNHIRICVSEASSNAGSDSLFSSANLPAHSTTPSNTDTSEWQIVQKYCKTGVLVIMLIMCSAALMINNEKIQDLHQISIQNNTINSYIIFKKTNTSKLNVMLEGALLPPYYGNLSYNWLSVWVQLLVVNKMPKSTSDIQSTDVISMRNISEMWKVPLVTENLIGVVPEVKYKTTFHLNSTNDTDTQSFKFLRLQFRSNLKQNLPLLMGYNLQPIAPDIGIIYAALLLIGLYVLIITEIIHRTLAAMLASTISVAILAVFNARPTLHEIVSWMDVETLILLFSMMILVTIFSETGIFDYVAFWAYKKTRGKLWPLINMLAGLVMVLSCVTDNVTTALLITPATIKLCEIIKVNPVPILTITVIFGNIGGAITPIGDPPNVVIASNKEVVKSGINFGVFSLHMGFGVLLAMVVVYVQLRFVTYRKLNCFDYKESIQVQDLKRGIAVLQRTAASVSSYSKDEEAVKENLLRKTVKLQGMLRDTNTQPTVNREEREAITLETLERQHCIKNKSLLIKSGVVLSLVIGVLLLHSIPALSRLGMGWTSLLGCILLLLLYHDEDMEGILARVEWSTLLFFASLFILMEALTKLGLIDFVGKQTQILITSVNPDARLTVAIVLILWVSGIASAFVDNLPLTTMMIKIATELSNRRDLNLPLQPLIWALSFGACFGGNGSLFGSSSNIVCAGVAEQHGYRFSFLQFMNMMEHFGQGV